MSRKSIDIDPPSSVEFKRAGPNGKTSRVMSTSMVAAYFNVSRNTVLAWKRDGCPVEREATKKGESDQLDIADVISWRLAVVEARAVGVAAEAAGLPPISGTGPDGLESKEQADARYARARANREEIEEARDAAAVAPVDAFLTMVAGDYARTRQGLEGAGSIIADRTAQITDPARIKEIADKVIRDAVEHLIPRLPGDATDEDDDALDAAA